MCKIHLAFGVTQLIINLEEEAHKTTQITQHIMHYQGPLNLPIKWRVVHILLTFLKKIQEIKHLKK